MEEAVKLQKQIHLAILKACFPLRKYKSNSSYLLKVIEGSNTGTSYQETFDFAENTSILGLIWEPSSDTFSIKCQLSARLPDVLTKRICFSELSRMFDPLGFLSPVTICVKILMQLIWREKLDWDIPLPECISQLCPSLSLELPLLVEIKVNRRYSPIVSAVPDQLLGFCDASLSAYCAVVYLCRTSVDILPIVSCISYVQKLRLRPLKLHRLASQNLSYKLQQCCRPC